MLLIALFQLLLLNLYHCQSKIPLLSNGGCTLVKDSVYFLGGRKQISATNKTNLENNSEVYKLNLLNGVNLSEYDEANWSTVEIKGDFKPTALLPGVVAQGDGSANIFMFGGVNVFDNETFRVFDTSSNKWSVDQQATNNWPIITMSNNQSGIYSVYSTTFLKGSGDEYVLFGGTMRNNTDNGIESRATVSVYSNNLKTWSQPQYNGVKIYAHTGCIYQGNMYIISGNRFDGNTLVPTDVILQYNLASAKWSNRTTKGIPPSKRVGASGTLVGSTFYLLGGTADFQYSSYPSSEVFTLNLDTFEWTKHEVTGFIATYAGCLVYYNKHLIYSFGYFGGDNQSKSQIIDTDTYKLVKSMPDYSNINSTSIDPNPPKDELNLGAVIGGSVAGFVVLIALLAAVFYYTKKNCRKNQENLTTKEQDFSQPPEYLKENVWSDGNVVNDSLANNREDLTFSLDTSTVLPDFDTDMRTTESSNRTKVL